MNEPPYPPRLVIEVALRDDAEAWQLAQFVKRVTFSDVRGRAESDDIAYTMLHGLEALGTALARKGFAPR